MQRLLALPLCALLSMLAPAVSHAQESALQPQALASAAAAAVGSPHVGFDLRGQITSTRRDSRPPGDQVGGFQLSVLAGVQLRGSASGQFGAAIAYFKRPTSSTGFELEGGITEGPTGRIYHGLLSVVLQSGARTSRLVPYLSLGGGMYHAQEKLRDSVRDLLPDFGIDPTEATETGPLLAFGIGFRYYLGEGTSFRADYREMRALTTGSGGFFDRLYGLRRIAGFLSFEL